MNQKIKLSELKNLVKEILQEEMSNNTPINKFAYFSYNYPPDFIKLIWGETSIANHLQEKFNSLYTKYGSRGVMNAFYVELSRNNQQIMEDYIINNYAG